MMSSIMSVTRPCASQSDNVGEPLRSLKQVNEVHKQQRGVQGIEETISQRLSSPALGSAVYCKGYLDASGADWFAPRLSMLAKAGPDADDSKNMVDQDKPQVPIKAELL